MLEVEFHLSPSQRELTDSKGTDGLTKHECEILAPLLYFNIFNHPLLEQEVFSYSTITNENQKNVTPLLNKLVEKKLIYCYDGYYTIQDKPELVVKRKQGNALAEKLLIRARMVSRFISWFPFVRGVFITGSLSKHYIDKDADIDYLVVTAQNRLWLCRSIIAIFKKAMIGPLKKYFCINYYLAENNLTIKDVNLFTATEIAFVYPMYNEEVYRTMLNQNEWVKTFYPNKKNVHNNINSNTYPISLKALIENLIPEKSGNKLDSYLHSVMKKRWDKRYKKTFSPTERDVNIRTQKDESKQHERGHQFVILQKFEEQISSFEEKHQVKFIYDGHTFNT